MIKVDTYSQIKLRHWRKIEMANVANVYRIDYNMKDSNWTARIAAFDSQEAVRQLATILKGKQFKVGTVQQECRLDALSAELWKILCQGGEVAAEPKSTPKKTTTTRR